MKAFVNAHLRFCLSMALVSAYVGLFVVMIRFFSWLIGFGFNTSNYESERNFLGLSITGTIFLVVIWAAYTRAKHKILTTQNRTNS